MLTSLPETSPLATRKKTSASANPAKSGHGLFRPFVDGVNCGSVDNHFGFMVRRAQILVFADFFRSIGDEAITPQRYTTLAIIGDNPGTLLSQLAEVMGVARPGATSLVDFWEGREAVARRPVTGDRRAFGLHLTAQGRRILARLHKRVGQHDHGLTECLTAQERATLMKLLRKFCQDAQERQQNPGG